MLLPHIWQHTDGSFQGVEMMPSDAELHYAARVREFFDGHWSVANTFYKNGKNVPYLQPPYPEASIAVAAKLFGVDPAWLFVWSRADFAFFLTLLFIGFLTSLSGRKWESLLAVTALLFAGSILSAPWDIPSLLTGDRLFEVLRFSRPINPLWTVPWFLGALWFLSAWMRKRSIWMIVGSALCTVVLLYSYVYAWTFIGVAMTVLFIRFVWVRDWLRIRDLLLFAALFFLFGSPYLLNLWASTHHPFYETAAQRMGMSVSHAPTLGVWSILFLIVTLCSKKIWKQQWWLVLGLAIAGIVGLNQHVITGAYLVPHHYQWYFVQPLAAVTTIVVVLCFLRSHPPSPSPFPRWGKREGRVRVGEVGYGVVMLLAVSCGVLVQYRAYNSIRDEWIALQKFAPIIASMKNLPADSAVYAQDRKLLDLLPIYTSLNVYAATNANTYLVDPQQVRDAFWFELWISGLKPEDAPAAFKTDLRYKVSSRIYNIYYRESAGAYDRIPDDVIHQLAAEYQYYVTLSTEEKLCKWPLEYVVFSAEDTWSDAWGEVMDKTTPVEMAGADGFTVRGVGRGMCEGM